MRRGHRARVLWAAALVAAVAACGRTEINPAAAPPADAAAPDGAGPDAGWPDASAADASPVDAAPPPPVGCADLRPLAARGLLTSRRTRQVLFTGDRRRLILRAAPQDAPNGKSTDLLLVTLPGGEITTLATDVTGAEWLGGERRIL